MARSASCAALILERKATASREFLSRDGEVSTDVSPNSKQRILHQAVVEDEAQAL